MLEKVNGANPSASPAYSSEAGAGASVKGGLDNRQEAGSSTSADRKKGSENSSADNRKIKDAIDKMNADMRFKRTGCEFTYHEECNRVSIKLYDVTTKEVIREIPSEDTIKMLEKLNEIAGLMIDEKM
ncbi:flagellar protein FlaG [[Clostridium] polysaccharolyticum]|uniref:FlaG protein n=1 Tax=[Clostridium] polysaccharolyticum TaxID=29364 RepID=A0A1I0CU25_9FIRM|nr:flagellar protein FlaG [[Clostridium] polysaccharolyticum]SET23239.1 FlaG protein [[Clostridium] polysaccharolyticum]